MPPALFIHHTCNIVPIDCSVTSSVNNTHVIWHHRLGHASFDRMYTLQKQIPFIECNKTHICDVCHLAKHNHLPFPISAFYIEHPFDLVHVDIWGPVPIASIHDHHYFLIILDDFPFHC